MSYEVTASRRRPKVFSELVGQEYVVQTLQNELRSKSVAQTFLFSGPRGVGKTSAARILAKALNCENGPTDSPCGTCGPCSEIARAQSLDVVEIDGASHTGVDDVRELREQIVFPPSAARSKVYIIDEVHMLSTSAFNALLKTIEEPPPYVTFIFATTEPHKVPATVRSRCQHFGFSLIEHERIIACLRDAATELDASVNDDALHWIARQAAGSLRDGFMILDQVIAGAMGQGAETVTLAGLRDSIGMLSFDDLNDLATAITTGDVPETLIAFDRSLSRGVSVDHFLAELVDYFRSVLFIRHGLNRDGWLAAPMASFPKAVIDALSVEQAEKAVELLLQAQRNLKGALNERCEAELVLSRLAELDRLITPSEILVRLRELQAAIAKTEDSSSPSLSIEEITSQELSELKSVKTDPDDSANDPVRHVMTALRKDKPSLASALERARTFDHKDNVLNVSFVDEERYSAQVVRQHLSEVASAFGVIGSGTVNVHIISEEKEREDHRGEESASAETVRRVFRGEIVNAGGE
jgi:DNA polymerase-3 subunit gamma/tau